MKKNLLCSIFLIVASISIYSQHNKSNKIDTLCKNNSISNYNGLIISNNFNKIIDTTRYFKIESKQVKLDFTNNKNSKVIDNMICIKPTGFYPMLINKPDSNKRYSMIVKKP